MRFPVSISCAVLLCVRCSDVVSIVLLLFTVNKQYEVREYILGITFDLLNKLTGAPNNYLTAWCSYLHHPVSFSLSPCQGHDTYDSLELVSYFTSQAELSPPIHSVAITPTAPTAPTAPTPTASTAAAATAATAATSTRAAPLPPPQSWVSSTNGQSQNRSSSSRRRRPARSSTSIHARINSGAIPSSSSSCLWKHIPMSRAAAAVGGRRGEGRRGRAREPSYPHSSSPME